MPVRRITQGLGLVTDPSALEAAELAKGAMRQATNVVMHRPGAIQCRPGFGDLAGIAEHAGSFYPVNLVEYVTDDAIVAQEYDGASWRISLVAADTQIESTSANAAPPDTNVRGRSAFVEARESLWYTSSAGVRKITDTTARRAGIWQTHQPVNHSLVDVGTDTDIASIDCSSADTNVAYRWLVRREDAKGYIQRGPPSIRSVITGVNATYGSGAWNDLMATTSLALPAEAEAGDVIEFYRTKNTAAPADPGEIYYLCATHEITAAEIAAGFAAAGGVPDQTTDENLGVELYTSTGQLGPLAAKYGPPYANLLAYWKGVTWAANGTERHTLALSVVKVAYEGAIDQLEGIGLCWNGTMTGNFSTGSDQITNVTFGTDVDPTQNGGSVVGMWVAELLPGSGTTLIPLDTKITAISGAGPYTLTMSNNAGDTQTGQSFKIGDVIIVDGVDYYVFGTAGIANRWIDPDDQNTSHAARISSLCYTLAQAVNYRSAFADGNVQCLYDDLADPATGNGSLLFTSINPGPAEAFTVQCVSRPSAFAEGALEDGVTSPSATRTDYLWYSDPDEPAAWPVLNFERVGNAGLDILALVPLDDALLIFADDGIYRITGEPPAGWVLDRIDTGRRLVAPDAYCVMDGVCYAWTDRGVVAVTEMGVADMISAAIGDDLREYQRELPLGVTGHRRGTWMQAHPRLGLVILNVALNLTDEGASVGQYVWHRNTGAWTTWTRTGDIASVYDRREDRLMVAQGVSAWAAYYERSDEDNGTSYQDRITDPITPTSWTSTTVVVIAKADVPWTPTVCDVLEHVTDKTYHQITSVVDSGSDWTITVTPAVSATAVTNFLVDEAGDFLVDEAGDFLIRSESAAQVKLHEGISATLLWQAQHLPGAANRWQEIHVGLLDSDSDLLSSWTMEVGGQTERDAAPIDVDATISADVDLSRPVRTGVPRNIARCAHLYPYVKICGAGVRWRIGELQLHHDPTSRRVRR